MTQLGLLDKLTTAYERHASEPQFGGATYEPERDGKRLYRLLIEVRRVLDDGQWHTLAEVAEKVHAPESSVSARIRDLRKTQFGGYHIESAYVRRGLWNYRLVR